ncbi:MAG: phosphoethanolamine transferase [Hydrocarboniphaga sp.]|uniref:phosphoethanolamine transferase n=1 Tax=Hydrocarboniphaga sp. TaxID=2033016 RepID=UPI00262784BF|nr:phosphoethanolamine--lipid A transferase [Hydrocarboniphaga sp.]MDB5972569.1 phosphoethanolamine transferase [Hydrocarboniphaga sp.]
MNRVVSLLKGLVQGPIKATTLTVIVAIYLTTMQNHSFWLAVITTLPAHFDFQQYLFLACLFVILNAALIVLLSILGAGPLLKPVLIAVLLIASVCSYFMDAFGTIIDEAMIVNSLQTDVHEVGDLFSIPFILHILGFGVVPAIWVARVTIVAQRWQRSLMQRSLLAGLALVVLIGGIAADYKQMSLWARPNKQVRLYINPSYPIYSAFQNARDTLSVKKNVPLIKLATDAKRGAKAGRPLLVVVVIGETARARNFSLLGYERPSNPELAKVPGLISYEQVSSCGTSTAISVPCMFSGLGRASFSRDKAREQENLLDVVKRTGIDVLWRDNNSGCKGVCARVATDDLFRKHDDALCNSEECLDEILLKGLDLSPAAAGRDELLVLHQKGSHGPAYFKRYPAEYRRFVPECARDDVQSCSREEITNAYDNTIVYTDHVLTSLIDILQAHAASLDSVMLYVSDHGESLGENGIYLHGLPYSIAPAEQTHVPMLAWLSEGARQSQGVDLQCLMASRSKPASHDNLFDTVLGLFHIETERYRADLDLFQACRGVNRAAG